MTRTRLAVLASGRGSNLQSIIDHAGNALPVTVAVVVSNMPNAYAIKRAHAAGIPTAVVSHRGWSSRDAFDAKLIDTIDEFSPDLVVLAGFMRILTARFVRHFDGRTINIHPSLLPALPGLDTHQRALDAGVSVHGASVHFVTEGMDEGPLIIQGTVPVKPDDNVEALAARVLALEHRILPQAVRWFAEGRLRLDNGLALLDGAPALEAGTLSDF